MFDLQSLFYKVAHLRRNTTAFFSFYSSLKWTSTWRYELKILDFETKPK